MRSDGNVAIVSSPLKEAVKVTNAEPASTDYAAAVRIVGTGGSSLTIQYDDAGSSITYIGKAVPGTATSAASWQIQKLDESSTPDFSLKWADGDGNFDNVWDNRASLSYS